MLSINEGNKFEGGNLVLQAALEDLKRGIHNVHIPFKKKGPTYQDWQKKLFTEEELPEHFKGRVNIGRILGEPSGGIVDVDLDCDEAIRLAKTFLPETGEIHGRTSNPDSHWWYKLVGEILPTRQFKDIDGKMIVEFRSTGGQTVIPPSVHESGENLVWTKQGNPKEIEGKVLVESVAHLASAVLLGRHWISVGSRQDMALAIGGFLLRGGVPAVRVKQIISVAATLAHDDETSKRVDAVDDTLKRLQSGRDVKGGPTLAELVGSKVVDRLADWLGLKFHVNEEENEEEKKDTVALRLINLAGENAEFLHDNLNEPFAKIRRNGHSEIWPMKSRMFERWIAKIGFENLKKAVSPEQMRTALLNLQACAVFKGAQVKLHNRVAPENNGMIYDLTNGNWQAVRISKEGWEIVNEPPILFKRYQHQLPQVTPVHGGDLSLLRPFVNVPTEKDWLLIQVYLVASFLPDIPHPVLNVFGLQGSAKSFLLRTLGSLIDPSAIETLPPPHDINQAIQIFSHHWYLPMDNLSYITQELSDLLCRAVTGQGTSKRELYTDDDDVIYSFKRVIAINGINNVANNPDLLDRSLSIELERIPKEERKTEEELLGNFEAAKAKILGGIFDVLAKAIAIRPFVKLSTLPRMADFAVWGCAIAQALGYKQEDFLTAYDENQANQNDEVVQSTPVTLAILRLIEKEGSFVGTATTLFTKLQFLAQQEKMDTNGKSWPKDPPRLMQKINFYKPNLLEIGIEVKSGDETDRRSTMRLVTIHKVGRKVAPLSDNHLIVNDDDDGNDGNATGLGETYSNGFNKGGI